MIVTDEAVYHMRMECDGKPSPLGCAVSIDTIQFTREQCNQHFYASGWRIRGKRQLCRACSAREMAKLAKRKPSLRMAV